MTCGIVRVDKESIAIKESLAEVRCFGALVITPTVVSAITFGVDLILRLSVIPIWSRIVFPLWFLSSVTEKYSMTILYKKILSKRLGIAYTIYYNFFTFFAGVIHCIAVVPLLLL